MYKLWLVAKQEYRIRTFKRSFIIGTLTIPVIIAIIIGVTTLIIIRSIDNRPVGYVDHSGLLVNASMQDDREKSIEIIRFNNDESAKTALEGEEIQAYYIIPEDYLNSSFVDIYYLQDAPKAKIYRDFDDYFRANVLDGPPTEIQTRIMEGTKVSIRALNDDRIFEDNESGILAIMLPMVVAMFFLFTVMGASGYFLQVVTDEKENRTMEIMITSISPFQLIVGKSLGLVAVGFTQIFVWVSSIVLAWIVALQYFEILGNIQVPWDILLILAIFFFPSYAIIAGVMICIGSVVNELQEGQQISGVLNLFFTFPIFFAALVFADPNSPLLVFLSMWPTTSLMTIIMRWGFTAVPLWQVAISWFICVIAGILVIWIASRLFRLGMLRYGQRVTLRTIFQIRHSIDQI